MDQKGEKDYMEEEIQDLIKTNQTLLRKKGLLKRLLDDTMIKKLLIQAGELKKEDGKENLLDKREKKLLEILEQNKFDLDVTIEKIVKKAAAKMKEENLQKKVNVTGKAGLSSEDLGELEVKSDKRSQFQQVKVTDGDLAGQTLIVSSPGKNSQESRDDTSLQKSVETSIDVGQKYTVMMKAIMREGPKKDSKEAGFAEKGSTVEALEEGKADDGTKRVLVKKDDGNQGWVSFVAGDKTILKKKQESATAPLGGG
tara:strand:- start:301 stop:1065 length:765 start_codon:yes stop_codon:yes gene_type:complete